MTSETAAPDRASKKALERVSDSVFSLDDRWAFTYLNGHAAALFDNQQEALLGSQIWEVVSDPIEKSLRDPLEMAVESGERVVTEKYVSQRNVWFEVTAFPSEDGLTVIVRDATSRIKHQQRLERYESIVETMNDGVYVVDQEGQFTAVNSEYESQTGYDRDELIGSHVSTVVDETVVERARYLEAEMRDTTEDSVTIEAPIERADGSLLDAEATFALLERDETGAMTKAGTTERVGVVRDITERAEREAELEQRVRQQAFVTKLGRQALVRTDLDELFEEAVTGVSEILSNKYCKVLDLVQDQEELALRAGVGWKDGYVGEATVGTEYESQAGYILMSAEPVVVESLTDETRFSGPEILTEHGVESGISVVIGSVDEPWGILGTHDTERRSFGPHDVTFVQSVANILATAIERDQYERDLERYEAFMQESTDVNSILDPDGTVRYVTPSVASVLGFDPEDLVGENLAHYLHPDDREQVLEEFAALIEEPDGLSTVETRIEHADGSWVVIEAQGRNLLDDPNIEGIVTYTRDVTDRKERERTLRNQRDQLDALAQINSVVRDVTDALIESSSREELESQVCDRLASSHTYEFAWIGTADASGERIIPTSSAGPHEDYLETLDISLDDGPTSHGPTALAIESGVTQVVQEIDEDRYAPWREAAASHGFYSSAAIPIRYDDLTFGVLNVYSGRANAFGKRERRVIAQLGEIIGHAITAIDRKEALVADSVTEFDVKISGIAEKVMNERSGPDPTIRLDRTIPADGGGYILYVATSDLTKEGLAALLNVDDSEGSIRELTDEEDATLYEVTVEEPTIVGIVAEYGGLVRQVSIRDETAHIRGEIPQSVSVRQVLEAVERDYSDVEFIGQRNVERGMRSDIEYVSSVRDRLTDRQLQVIEAAYFSGYYEWPRSSSGGDVAGALGISNATLSQHLRSSHRKLAGVLFDKDPR